MAGLHTGHLEDALVNLLRAEEEVIRVRRERGALDQALAQGQQLWARILHG
jgi:hypothetical protein